MLRIGRILVDKSRKMKKINVFILVAFMICMGMNCSENRKKSNLKIEEMVGFIHQDCLAIKNKTLTIGEEIQLILLEEKQKLATAKIQSKIDQNESCVILLEDRKEVNLENDWSFYKINNSELELAIAITVSNLPTEQLDDFTTIDLDGDGSFERFSICNTSEGINFTAWSDEPWKSQELWSDYYYLGYDMEPSCPE